MSKKKKVISIVAIILAIVLSFLGGQTYSKYVSRVRGDGIAEVATWDFKVNGQKEQVQTISLGSTYDPTTLIDGKIAPGTRGDFQIVVDGTGSDVGIDYNIKFSNESTKPQNLKFYYQNQQFNSITDLEDALSGTINANDDNKVRNIRVSWEWKYETGTTAEEINANDKVDTINSQEIANYTFNVDVSGTQVIPQS